MAIAGTPRPGTDLLVPLQDAPPRLHFHAGMIGPDGQPLLLPTLPAIPGPASPWYVAQWQQASYLTPESMQTPPQSAGHWRFDVPDGHSSVAIDQFQGGYAYTLSEADGKLTGGGGANLFLATNVLPGVTDFGAPVVLSFQVRLTDATISYTTSTAEETGAVQAMAFVGLGLMFHGATADLDRFIFMQVPITVSRQVPSGPGIICALVNDQPNLLYAPAVSSLPFRIQSAATDRRYDLSALVRTMLSAPYPCGGQTLAWPQAQQDPASWSLTGLYVGLETQNQDTRAGAASSAPQGHASAGIQISGLSVRRL